MNNFRRITITFAGIVTTGLLSAGAAAAHPQPLAPSGGSVHLVGSVTTARADAGPTTRAQVLLRQKAHTEHMQRLFAAREAAAVAARRQAEVGQPPSMQAGSGSQSQGGSGSGSHGSGSQSQGGSGSQSQGGSGSHRSGNGTDVAVLAVTGLAGLALGAAGSTASRRLRARSELAA